jgi:GTP diphosphokinase / guanosine-3',5'-bis(diphosphate) 3'-diphosphatase
MVSVNEITSLMSSPSADDTALIERAYAFSQKSHAGHERRSGDPYFIHPVETAKILAENGLGPRAIAAGLLHDTVEDVGVDPEVIKRHFGDDIYHLVQGVTKLGTLRYRGMKRHIESLLKLFVATSLDVRVVIIKLADRLHNMRTLAHVPKHKQKRIAIETLEIYGPVANRLGMGKLRGELEDLAFPYVYPEKYKMVKELFKSKSKETLKRLAKFDKALKKLLATQKIKIIESHYRVKHLYSLFRKLERKDWDIDKINDISALRIIVPTIQDCYRILGVIHSNWRPMPGKIKDYIAFEKPNGYQSLHTSVLAGDGGVVEIQIRTPKIHQEAEYGIASHILYKNKGSGILDSSRLVWIRQLIPTLVDRKGKQPDKTPKSKEQRRYLKPNAPQWIKQIAETHQHPSQSDDFLQNLKADFFSQRVFVFTPKGDVIDLPIESSTIDFAYAVHSDIGDHISGAKVNGKLVSLDTKLSNGDIVEIMTKESSKPTAKWLDHARTTLAKRKIRSATGA